MNANERRLFVYLLLDCSGSMNGEPIVALQQGVASLLSELRADRLVAERTLVSVITFSNRAAEAVPPSPLDGFRLPELRADGGTAMGEALDILLRSVERNVGANDFEPLCFLLTDGSPSDTEMFNSAAKRIPSARMSGLVACAAGSKAKTEYLSRLTDNVLVLNTVSAGDLSRFFRQISMLVRASASLERPPELSALIAKALRN